MNSVQPELCRVQTAFRTPFWAQILGWNPCLGNAPTQNMPTLHYPPAEPMPGATTGILACVSLPATLV